MKFVVSRVELSNLIRKIQNIVPQNAPMPILSHCLVDANHGELTFTATDLVVGVKCSVQAKIVENGSLSIPTKHFFQLVRELTDTSVEISSTEAELVEIKAGASYFRLRGLGKERYPELPNLSNATQFSLPSKVLKEMFFRTAFAVSKEENRYAMKGVLMRIIAGTAIFVGTDGKRLAKTQTEIAIDPEFSADYVIPLKAIDEILKNLSDDEPASIFLGDGKIAIESGNTFLVTKLLSGEYPDYEQIIPKERGQTITLHREELITLLRQVSLFTNEEALSVRFTFTPGELIVRTNSSEVGDGVVSMAVNYQEGKFEIAFNPYYFRDILCHIEDETVDLNVSDPFSPGVITDSTASLFVIMPMRLDLSDD